MLENEALEIWAGFGEFYKVYRTSEYFLTVRTGLEFKFSNHWEGFSQKFGFVDCFVKEHHVFKGQMNQKLDIFSFTLILVQYV